MVDTHEDPDSDSEAINIFADPEGYYPPSPKPTTETHTLLSGEVISLRLVGHNPLWGHHLWQAARIISHYLEKNPSLVAQKTILELGAGAGLPSLISVRLGASKVVVTDYPDPDLIQNLWTNITNLNLNPTPSLTSPTNTITAQGFLWGADPAPLLAHAPEGFDVLFLADLLFNHSEHGKLLSTLKSTLKKSKEAKAYVFFTPYRPWLYEKDMAFFELCRAEGMLVEKVLEEQMKRVMFEGDRGDEGLRRMVFGWVVRWDL